MVYVQRDSQGRLMRVEQIPFAGMSETMSVQDEELHNWLNAREEVVERLANLRATDLDLVRVLEDVVAVLVERQVIHYTDLPVAARQKLDERALSRAEIEGLSSLLGGAERLTQPVVSGDALT